MLPFVDISGDPGQEYFADGISEDLVTGLARIRWLFVIARNSTFVYKHRAVDVKQVSRELGVRYVLEGSVRRAGNRLRITAQLDRCDDRRPPLGRALRARARRHLRRAGRDHAQRRRRHRAAPAGGRRHPRAGPVAAASRCLGARGPGADAFLANDARRSRGRHRAPENRPSRPIPTMRRRAAGSASAWCSPRTWAGSARERGLLGRPRARHAGDRARRLRSVGTHRAGLLGDDGAAHGGIDRGVPAGRAASIPIPPRPIPISAVASPSPGAIGEAIEHRQGSDPAQPARSGDGAVPGRHRRRPLHGRPLRPGGALHDRGASPAPGLPGGAAAALRQPRPGPAASRKRAPSWPTVRREQPRLSLDWVRGNVPYQTRELMDRFVEGLRRAGLR